MCFDLFIRSLSIKLPSKEIKVLCAQALWGAGLVEERQVQPELFSHLMAPSPRALPSKAHSFLRLTTSLSSGNHKSVLWLRSAFSWFKHCLRTTGRMLLGVHSGCFPLVCFTFQGLQEPAWEREVQQLSFLSLWKFFCFLFWNYIIKKDYGKQQQAFIIKAFLGSGILEAGQEHEWIYCPLD